MQYFFQNPEICNKPKIMKFFYVFLRFSLYFINFEKNEIVIFRIMRHFPSISHLWFDKNSVFLYPAAMKSSHTSHTNCPTRAIIDLNAFRNNINIVRKKFPGSRIILPVKANAYGHGSIIISTEAEKIGIDYLAVARLGEALELRQNGIGLPIMILGVENRDNIKTALSNDIELSVSCMENIIEIEEYSKSLKKPCKIHMKINTGMTRLGFNHDDYLEPVRYVKNSEHLGLASIYTHFARSDDSKEFTDRQIDIFFGIRDTLKKLELLPGFFHMYNSGAVLDSYRNDCEFAIRPGIMCYGYSPFQEDCPELKPVMNLKSRVIHLRDVPGETGVSYNHTFVTKKPSILATIPAGYGDGIHRVLSNKFSVTINGKHYPQRGTITMDLMVVEVDDSVKVGDEVVIFGNKDKCINDAGDLAAIAQTISYEITTSISARVEREAF
jgi:alanine racemase